MSRKITAKNLQYTTTLPPFLARLRGQHASETDRDAPDPILAARRRPGKQRSGSAEAEDAPLVVDEHGNTVADVTVSADGTVKEKEEGQAESAAEDAQNDGDNKSNSVAAGDAAGEKLPGVIQAGAQRKKRKIGRVVGADVDEGDGAEEDRDGNEKGGAKTSKPATATTQEPPQERDDSSAAAKAKTKKKAKKIKLSFGDDEG